MFRNFRLPFLFVIEIGILAGCGDSVPYPKHVAPEHSTIVDQLVSLHARVLTDDEGHVAEVRFFHNDEARNPTVSDAQISFFREWIRSHRWTFGKPTSPTKDLHHSLPCPIFKPSCCRTSQIAAQAILPN